MPRRRKSGTGKRDSKDSELEEAVKAILRDIAGAPEEPESEPESQKQPIVQIIIYESSVWRSLGAIARDDCCYVIIVRILFYIYAGRAAMFTVILLHNTKNIRCITILIYIYLVYTALVIETFSNQF